MDLINYLKSKLHSTKNSDNPQYNFGEILACRLLKSRGYKILEKNYRSRFGEIDIIAEHSKMICFVEVKSRMNTRFGLPEEYVDKRKQKKLLITSMFYLNDIGKADIDMRFDVVSVDLKSNSCRIIKNAFEVDF